jgi:alpha-N-arabinofuranosidase
MISGALREYVNGSSDTPMGDSARRMVIATVSRRVVGIGNEVYGEWQWDISTSINSLKHNQFAKAMRAVDPSIKLVASGATRSKPAPRRGITQTAARPAPYEFGSKQDWSGNLLERCATHRFLPNIFIR